MSKVVHIGDLHLDHMAICQYRTQFSSVEEHNDVMVDKCMSVLSKRDILWLHGDIFFTEAAFDKYAPIMFNHVEQVKIIIGNHCTQNKERQRILKKMLTMFDNVDIHSLVNKYGSWLSHHPIHPDELYGKFNIHGHTHTHNIDDPRYFNVSADQINYTPMSTVDIKDIIKERLKS